VKKGWEVKALASVSAINYGYTESATSEPVGPRFLRITDIQDDCVDWNRVPFCKIESSDLPKYRLDSGDIVFARTGATTGKSFLVDAPPEAVFASYLIRLRLLDEKLLPEFVMLFFQTADYWQSIKDGSSGSAQGGFNATKLGALKISIPPLAEQQRIVGLLDEAFVGIATAKANAEKNLQNARALFESHLQSVFTQRGPGWVRQKLNSITTKIGSGATPRGGGESYKAQGVSLIRSLNVHDFGFKYAKLAFLDDRQADELSNVVVRPRDVLLNITGASVARCTIVPEDVLPARVNQHVSIIRPAPETLDADFLHYLLVSKPYKDQLLKTGDEGGSTRQAITKAQIQDFVVDYPLLLSDQNSIVTKLDAILAETQRLARLYEQKLAALDELKKSLLHQAFSGAL
jgi:type I restriction enzyme, S subunit